MVDVLEQFSSNKEKVTETFGTLSKIPLTASTSLKSRLLMVTLQAVEMEEILPSLVSRSQDVLEATLKLFWPEKETLNSSSSQILTQPPSNRLVMVLWSVETPSSKHGLRFSEELNITM